MSLAIAFEVHMVGANGRARDCSRDGQGFHWLQTRQLFRRGLRNWHPFDRTRSSVTSECVLGNGNSAHNRRSTCESSATRMRGTHSLKAENRIEKRPSTIDSNEGCEVHTSFAAWVLQWGCKQGSGSLELGSTGRIAFLPRRAQWSGSQQWFVHADGYAEV